MTHSAILEPVVALAAWTAAFIGLVVQGGRAVLKRAPSAAPAVDHP